MAEYTVSLRDEASSIAGKIRSNVAALRAEMRAIGQVRVSDGSSLSSWLKATAVQTAGRAASEMAAAALIRRTTAANLEAARAAGTRVSAERRVAASLARTLHYEMRLASVRGHRGGGGGGGTTNMPGMASPDGGGGGGWLGRAAPWLVGGAAVVGGGIAAFVGAKTAIAGLSAAGGMALGILDGLASAIVRAASAAGTFSFEFGKATVSAFDFRTRATMALGAMRGDGEREFGRLKSLAVEMGTSLEGTFAGIRALSAAGFGASEAEQMFKRLQDMKGIGLDQPTLDRLVLAISQIKGAGVLQGDELRQIQETGINVGSIWEEIAKSMGVSVQQARKLKEAGKVSADVAIPAIMAAMKKTAGGGEAGELGKAMGRKTAEGFANRAVLLKSLFFDRVAKDSEGGISRVLETLNQAADGLLGWMETDDAKSFFADIGGGIKSMAGDLSAAFKSDTARRYLVEVKELFLGAWHVGEGLWSVTKAFVQGFAGRDLDLSTTKQGLEGIAEALKSEEATVFFRNFGTWASWASETALYFATNIKGVADGARVVIANVNALVDSVRSLGASLYTEGSNAASALISGFSMGILGGLPSVLGAVASVGSSAVSGLMGALDAHSPSRKTEQVGSWATEGLARGMAANDNARSAAATVAGDVHSEMMAGLGVTAGGSTTQIAGDVSNSSAVSSSRSVGPIYITVQGGLDAAAQDDLEQKLVAIFERVA